jgi:hypothetical protein
MISGSRNKIAKVVTIRPLGHDETPDKIAYWLSRPIAERIAHVEELREDYWGEDYGTRLRIPRTADAVKRVRR